MLLDGLHPLTVNILALVLYSSVDFLLEGIG